MSKKVKDKNKDKKGFAIFLVIIDVIAIFCFIAFYGPFKFVSDRLVTTAMTTMTHKYFARTMYTEDYINTILARNVTLEIDDDTDVSAIDVNSNEDTGVYDSIYDKEILQRDEGNDLYKIIDVSGSTWKGWIVAVYDPSRIELVLASNLKKGLKTTMMAKENDAVIAINGGGFVRRTNKVIPTGTYIQDGKIVYTDNKKGKLIGMTKDNVLVLVDTTPDEAINMGIEDAMQFSPFLIVNGVPSTFKGDGGYGKRSRTAIGQRQDGIILMVVIDGKRGSTGISMPDLTDLFLKYKAYNAANLDGGGSSTLVVDQELHNSPAGWDYTGERWNINAWIVK